MQISFISMLFLAVILVNSIITSNAATSTYSSLCDSAFCRIVEDSMKDIGPLKSTIDEGSTVAQLGQKADQICNSALERFSQEAPLPDDADKKNEALYDKKVEELERFIDAPLHVLYMKQLTLLREKALKTFKSSLTVEGGEFEAMMQADEFFRREAEESTRQNPEWEYARETQNLKSALGEITLRAKKAQDIKLAAAKQTQQAMQYLNIQAQQMQAIQQQLQGANSPWNIGAAYRVPDSNINLSCSYQQGRGNVQITCVPDESAPMLGANGFVNGVTPGNVGLSFNINL